MTWDTVWSVVLVVFGFLVGVWAISLLMTLWAIRDYLREIRNLTRTR